MAKRQAPPPRAFEGKAARQGKAKSKSRAQAMADAYSKAKLPGETVFGEPKGKR